MCKYWIFIITAEFGAPQCVFVCKTHSLIDLAVSQCNRSFNNVFVCNMIVKRMGKRAGGTGRADKAGQLPSIKHIK